MTFSALRCEKLHGTFLDFIPSFVSFFPLTPERLHYAATGTGDGEIRTGRASPIDRWIQALGVYGYGVALWGHWLSQGKMSER